MRTRIQDLNDSTAVKEETDEVVVSGWILTARWQKKVIFIKLSDCHRSKLNPLQVVCDKQIFGDSLDHLSAGCSLLVKGKIVKSPGKGQEFELVASEIYVYGNVADPASYPLAKADLPFESMRLLPHLECHTPEKASVYLIRSVLMESLEEFFKLNNYTKTDMPLITFSECEGGCQPMQATLLLTSGKMTDIPQKAGSNDVDFSKDFFGSKSSLTVSAQMELETQLPLGNVWTVTRAIRGEPSQTTKHLCEFTMIELEKAFSSSAQDIIQISESCIKYCIEQALKKCDPQLTFLENKLGKSIKSDLTKYLTEPFVRITHAQAVEMIQKNPEKFLTVPTFSDDLSSEHEKYIVDHYQLPVVVCKYPKAVKAFYMPVVSETLEESHGVEHVDSFDILVPGTGELVGGSQRIDSESELMERINELGIDPKPLEFYINLRRTGSIPHGGMGMGFERLVKFVTGVDSVKDCVAFPRFVGCNKSA
ncbi:MAG: asparagine--tRNA ligase [Proteobacteria bacterium]|nr:asparagine--tRNA ligase [Pseudomonadota bacterium]